MCWYLEIRLPDQSQAIEHNVLETEERIFFSLFPFKIRYQLQTWVYKLHQHSVPLNAMLHSAPCIKAFYKWHQNSVFLNAMLHSAPCIKAFFFYSTHSAAQQAADSSYQNDAQFVPLRLKYWLSENDKHTEVRNPERPS